MLFKQFEALAEVVGQNSFVGYELIGRSRLDPSTRDHRNKREHIGFTLLSGRAADAVIACSFVCVRRVHQEMCKLVKHHKQPSSFRQLAVNGDEMAAHHAVIKSADAQRDLFDRDPEMTAEFVKISFGKRTLVPADV